MEPTSDLATYRSHKIVRAGKITEVVEAGCYVQEAGEGSAKHLRLYDEGMLARYQPKVGDYWVVYDGEYQSISPGASFEAGYALATGWTNMPV